MTDLYFETIDRLDPILRNGDVAVCEREAVGVMNSLRESPFHIVSMLSISNDPISAARHFDAFYDKESSRIPIAVVYTEMNGFDINTDRWFCDLFAYTKYGGQDDYDWLADWQSEPFPDYTILGLDQLQLVFGSEAKYKDEFSDARFIADLLVVIKFQAFMKAVAREMRTLNVPLFVTAHDYDFIAEIQPRQLSDRVEPPIV